MGSAALSEAIKSINEWSLNEGVASTSPSKAAEEYGSLVFSDKAAAGAPAEGGLPCAARHDYAGRSVGSLDGRRGRHAR